jgi:integrase
MTLSDSASGSVFRRDGVRGGVWYAKWRGPDGRQVQRRLGRAWTRKSAPPEGYLTRRGAEAKLRELLLEAQRGQPAARRVSGATFGDACDEWLRYVEHDRQRRPSTVAGYRNTVEKVLKPAFGADTPLEKVTTERIDRWRAEQIDRPLMTRKGKGKLTARSINKYLGALSSIFKRAQRVYGLPENPVAAVDRQPQWRVGKIDVLEPGEVVALTRAASSNQDAATFAVAAFTGLRMGELRALRWADVDFAKRLVHVRRGYAGGAEHEGGKSHRVRSVPMIDQVVPWLDRLSRRERFTDSDDLVFPSPVGRHFDDSTVRKAFKDALKTAGLKTIRFHDLRHTFGTIAVQAFPLTDVKAMMGHADISTTMIYVHYVPAHNAAERLSRAFAAGDSLEGFVPDFVPNSPKLSETEGS